MTEDEAKTKWCPFIQYSVGLTQGAPFWITNRNDSDTTKIKCIASECMAWRWNGFATIATAEKPQGSGYCGLAGKP